ncbi:hypothetical protein D3C84_922760 [compost metagenome]
MDRIPRYQLPSGGGRHLDAVHRAEQLHHSDGDPGRLGSDPEAHRAVHGRVPDHVRPDQRCFCRAGCDPVLRVLRGHADPDVPDHRCVGRSASRLRFDQVLPVHPAGFAADAGGVHLPVLPGRQDL